MVHYKLTYFDTRGLAEAIRLIFKYANVDFENHRITFGEWPKIKPTTPTGFVPVLEFDGNYLVESAAICRYLARKHGLAGKGDLEEAKVDAIVDQNKDFFAQCLPWLSVKYGFQQGDEADLKKTKVIPQSEIYLPLYQKYLKESGSGFLADLKKTKVIPQSEIYLPLYQKYLKESGSGFLVKSGLTFADFIVSEFLTTLRLEAPDVLEKYPDILQYLDRMKTLLQLKEYYSTRKEAFDLKK
uniref:Glutathione S-transferase n=1 Tax=Panagrolaimus sp. ES5 TaxID=591445 RepID=A0AC34FVW9_9BILA